VNIKFIGAILDDKTNGLRYQALDGEAFNIPVNHTCTVQFTIQNISTVNVKCRLLVEIYDPSLHVIASAWTPTTGYFNLTPNMFASSAWSGNFTLSSTGLYIIREYVEYEDASCDEVLCNIYPQVPVNYTLTLSVSGQGSTSPSVGSHTYAQGTVVSIRAIPGTGYKFVKWTGDISTVVNPHAASTKITMNGDCQITANFEETTPPPPPSDKPVVRTLPATDIG